MIKFSSPLKLNEIHKVDSPFNEDHKNLLFSREALVSGEERSEKLGEMSNNKDSYCYANKGVINFEREYQPLPPGCKILVMPQFSYMLDQILGKKNEKLNFQDKI